jgi:mycothiol synthase
VCSVNIAQRSFSDASDKLMMSALVHRFPTEYLHIADLPYRFSSWAFDDPANISLWFDDALRLVAWAVLQTPFWALDFAYDPSAELHLHRHILAWADRRAREIRDTPGGRPAWYVNVFAEQADRIRELEEAEFASQADIGEDSWSKVLMQRPAYIPVDAYSLPSGFTIRPLAGECEVDAYVALHRAAFGTENMTAAWRARTLHHPDYCAELDLVAVAPDGCLAAFCIGWFDTHIKPIRGQVEPLGVHPDFRHLGLGRAILSECLRRLYEHGAEHIYVETDNYRDAALELYESAGFRTVRDVWVYGKEY